MTMFLDYNLTRYEGKGFLTCKGNLNLRIHRDVINFKADHIDNFKVQQDVNFVLMWGSTGTGNGRFHKPHGVATDGSGNVYVADNCNHRIQRFDSSGKFLLKWSKKGSGDGQFNNPTGMAVDGNGCVYVVEWNGHRVQKFCSSTVGISLTVKTSKEHGREKRAYTRRNYNPGNYNIAKEDRFIRDEFSTTVYIRN